ncbi:hypothetical protein AB0J01_27895 [Streptomyces sp. NPDC050204]|uniref:hypothetical protein n=1 Tax=Streptomyces sp. NPDC050204 TaxID=3155514 RepID=UPI003430D161
MPSTSPACRVGVPRPRRRPPISPKPAYRFGEIFVEPVYSDPDLAAAYVQEWENDRADARRRRHR